MHMHTCLVYRGMEKYDMGDLDITDRLLYSVNQCVSIKMSKDDNVEYLPTLVVPQKELMYMLPERHSLHS